MWSVDLVPAFVNTRVISEREPGGRETLVVPVDLDRWAAAHRIDTAPADADDLDLARTVREGMRAQLARHNDAQLPGDADALERFDRALPSLPLHVVRGDDVLRPAGRAGSTVPAAVLAAAVRARLEGSWDRLKACRDPLCREAYRDTTRNRSRSWCSMEICGARSKQRAFIDRRRAARG